MTSHSFFLGRLPALRLPAQITRSRIRVETRYRANWSFDRAGVLATANSMLGLPTARERHRVQCEAKEPSGVEKTPAKDMHACGLNGMSKRSDRTLSSGRSSSLQFAFPGDSRREKVRYSNSIAAAAE
jgi:hypothetical protein